VDAARGKLEYPMNSQTPRAELSLSWQFALLQVAIMASTTITPIATDISCVALALWAMRGPLGILQSLSLFIVIRDMNPSLIHWGTVSIALGWSLPLLVSVRILPSIMLSDLRVLGPLWLFCLVAIVCSIATSQALSVSIMKAASLAIIASAILVANFRLSRFEVRALGSWLRTLAVVVATLSLAILMRAKIAHFSDSNLLQGILNQPQALGAYLAPFSAAYVSSSLFRKSRTDYRAIAIMMVLVVCMLLTLSRTAAIATILGSGMSLYGGAILADRHAASEKWRLLGYSFLLVVVLSAAELAGSEISSSISGFIFKGSNQNMSAAFLASRGEGVISELRNFSSSPFVGNGFGVYANGVFPTGIVEVVGIPVSAPVEKGVLPTAVLEETGLVGFSFFAYMIFALVRAVWRSAQRSVLAMFLACLFVNLGEAVLLSPGNIGLHIWLLIGWCLRVGMPESGSRAELHSAPDTQAALPRPYANLLE
jgi:hypothetical protein